MDDWDAVAGAINARMQDLGVTQVELAMKSGVSVATIRDLQHNRSPRQRRPRTLAALSAALRWPPDHLLRVLRGGRDIEVADSTPSTAFTEVMSHLDAIQAQVQSVAERVSQLERLVGPPDQQRRSDASRDA